MSGKSHKKLTLPVYLIQVWRFLFDYTIIVTPSLLKILKYAFVEACGKAPADELLI